MELWTGGRMALWLIDVAGDGPEGELVNEQLVKDMARTHVKINSSHHDKTKILFTKEHMTEYGHKDRVTEKRRPTSSPPLNNAPRDEYRKCAGRGQLNNAPKVEE